MKRLIVFIIITITTCSLLCGQNSNTNQVNSGESVKELSVKADTTKISVNNETLVAPAILFPNIDRVMNFVLKPKEELIQSNPAVPDISIAPSFEPFVLSDPTVSKNLNVADLYNSSSFGYGSFSNIPVNYYYGSTTTTFPGMTSLHIKSAGFNYNAGDFSFSTGANVWAYSSYGSPYYDLSMSVSADYALVSWLSVGAYANYSMFAAQNAQAGSMIYAPFVPTSSYGVNVNVKLNRRVSVGGSVGQQLNPHTMRWETVYFFSPSLTL